MQYDDLQVFGGDQRTNGRAVIRSTDAGQTWNDMTNDATVDEGADTSLLAGGVTGMHPDQHALASNPYNPNFFFVGSDGGVVRVNGTPTSTARAHCAARQLTGNPLRLCRQVLRAVPERIDSLNDGLRTLQFQSVSLNPAQPGSDLLPGTQDNGTWAFDTNSNVPNGFHDVRVDRRRRRPVPSIGLDDVKVHTYFGPTMDANFGADGGNNDSPRGWDYISQPLDEANADPDNPEAFSFYVSLLAHDPKDAPGTLFTGGEYVWRTTDNGGDRATSSTRTAARPRWRSATARGSAATGSGSGARSAPGPTSPRAPAMTSSPSSARRRTTGTLWVGTRQGHLWVSHNADATSPAAGLEFSEVKAPVRSPVGSSRRSRSTRATPTTCGSPTGATRPTRRPRRATCSTCASTLPPAPATQPTCPTTSATSR